MVICLAAALGIGQGLTALVQWPWLYWAVTIPGTFLHESAHWIFAWALQGNPTSFSIIPTLQGDPTIFEILFTKKGNAIQSLGHVMFYPNWYNAATVGLAPLLLGVLGIYTTTLSSTRKLWKTIPLGYAAACCFASMWPSGADWSLSVAKPLSFLLMLPILGAFTWGMSRAFLRRWR